MVQFDVISKKIAKEEDFRKTNIQPFSTPPGSKQAERSAKDGKGECGEKAARGAETGGSKLTSVMTVCSSNPR